MGIVALVLGVMAAWMSWIVHKFLDGGGWYDLIVGLILDELILAVGLFAFVLLIRAIFAPAWLDRILVAAGHKLVWAILLVGTLFGLAAFILLFIGPILLHFGVVR